MTFFHTVFESDQLTAIWHGPSTTRTQAKIVTFEGVGGATCGTAHKQFFGARLVNSLNTTIIHVIPAKANWYQDSDILRCLEVVRPHLATDAFGYGSSMGGYAVARFADTLGLTRAVALSPRYSVDPNVAPWAAAKYRQTDHITFRYDGNRPKRRTQLWQLLDPLLPTEALHAAHLADEGPTHTLHVPGAGHPVGPALAECGLLTWLAQSFLQKVEDPAQYQSEINARLPNTSFALMAQANRQEGTSKLKLLSQALERNPLNPVLRRRCARTLEALGRTRAAELMRALPRSEKDVSALQAALLDGV